MGQKYTADWCKAVSYTHLRAHETVLDLVCRLLLEKKKWKQHEATQHVREILYNLCDNVYKT